MVTCLLPVFALLLTSSVVDVERPAVAAELAGNLTHRAVASIRKREGAEIERLRGLNHTFFDIEIAGVPKGRMVFALYHDTSPLAAENFRALCTGNVL